MTNTDFDAHTTNKTNCVSADRQSAIEKSVLDMIAFLTRNMQPVLN